MKLQELLMSNEGVPNCYKTQDTEGRKGSSCMFSLLLESNDCPDLQQESAVDEYREILPFAEKEYMEEAQQDENRKTYRSAQDSFMTAPFIAAEQNILERDINKTDEADVISVRPTDTGPVEPEDDDLLQFSKEEIKFQAEGEALPMRNKGRESESSRMEIEQQGSVHMNNTLQGSRSPDKKSAYAAEQASLNGEQTAAGKKAETDSARGGVNDRQTSNSVKGKGAVKTGVKVKLSYAKTDERQNTPEKAAVFKNEAETFQKDESAFQRPESPSDQRSIDAAFRPNGTEKKVIIVKEQEPAVLQEGDFTQIVKIPEAERVIIKTACTIQNNQTKEIELKLEPESLGKINIKISCNQDKLDISIKTTAQDTHNVLSEDIHSLKAALEARGIGINHLSIGMESGMKKRHGHRSQQYHSPSHNRDFLSIDELDSRLEYASAAGSLANMVNSRYLNIII